VTETAVPNVLKSEVLARFVMETPSEAVPDAMVKKAVRHILDSIGAGVAGGGLAAPGTFGHIRYPP